MTNKTISAILEHLSNEARNSVHATFGIVELVREVIDDPMVRTSVAIGRAGADQLLRSIDDVRDLLSPAPFGSATLENFDLVGSVSEIVEMLNLASGKLAKRMVLDGSFDPLLMEQDRRAVEQVITRVLDTAFKAATTNTIRVKLGSSGPDDPIQITIAARDTHLATRLVKWLNADIDDAALEDSGDVAFEVGVMVAGKHLRALAGSAELVQDQAGHGTVVLTIPAQAPCGPLYQSVQEQEAQPDALSILVAEDCDDSFALSELVLQREQVRRARDGREALRMIQKQRFDVVLMDVHMPGMDGYSAIRGMREWETQTGNARTPIVVLSSDDLETQRQSAAQCGCSGFLRKPLQLSDLTNLLERVREARTLVA
jgi:hypothetical protein